MSITLLALGAGLLLLPVTSPAAVRARLLTDRGRLAVVSTPPVGRALVVRPEVLAGLGWAAATLAVVAAGGVVLGAAAAIASATLARLVLAARRTCADTRRLIELRTALGLMAAELEAGARPSAAFGAAAEACPEHRATFSAAAEACRRGDDPSLDAAALEGLAHAWRAAALAGAPLSAVVARVGDDLAARLDQRRSVMSAMAGGRSSAAMLAGLPVLGLLLGAAMQAHPLTVLFGSPSGRLLCLVGVALDAAGLHWAQQITARAARP